MNDNQYQASPIYDNRGFQHEERRPPSEAPQQGLYPCRPQEIPSYVAVTPNTINTHHSAPPAAAPEPAQRKGQQKCPWKRVLCGCLSGGRCLSPSQWCDGVHDCSHGEDESHCFRLHGTNFLLEAYSPESRRWMPLCAESWDNNYGRAVCEHIGYNRQDYVSYTQTSAGSLSSGGYMKLQPGSKYGAPIHSQLTFSSYCTARVKLQCIECGVSSADPSTRIVGGTEAWLVYSGDVSLVQMHIGSGKTVDKIISHEKFNTKTNDNDIALLKLFRPLSFTRTVKPVCLPNIGVDLSEHPAWITGWGALRSSGHTPDRLNQAQVTIYSRENCNRPQVLEGQITQTMICAGKLQGGVDTWGQWGAPGRQGSQCMVAGGGH
ncbi:Transmembrane protease serine 2 [Dissostichus eleginoides]|uniref:Transmembrane protease serine 2 n=1 Tax=Dissostichus eleginoides TaxID=100907 RepID=A0AAD9F267_DISEL|nr:Transmembrane protease serine 2 [Dissostichus eleginoides]